MEAAFEAERESLVGVAQQSEGAALLAVEDIRARFVAQQQEERASMRLSFETDLDGLRNMHALELGSLRQRLQEESQAQLEAATRELQARAQEAVERVRGEEHAMGLQNMARLEAEVTRALAEANERAAAARAAAEAELLEQHTAEVSALREDAERRQAEASQRVEQAEQFATEQVGAARALFEAELQSVRDNSVPTHIVEELRDRLEQEALDALQGAVAEAVNATRQEAEAQHGLQRLSLLARRVYAVSYTHLTLPTNREV